MIERPEEYGGESAEVKVARIKSIASKRRVLEEDSARVQREIRTRFSDLLETVQAREKQLLRQAEAIHRQQMSVAESNEDDIIMPSGASVCVLFEGSDALTERLRAFGRIELRGAASFRITNREPYEIAEYQDSSKDHVSFDKFIAENSVGPETVASCPGNEEDVAAAVPHPSEGRSVPLGIGSGVVAVAVAVALDSQLDEKPPFGAHLSKPENPEGKEHWSLDRRENTLERRRTLSPLTGRCLEGRKGEDGGEANNPAAESRRSSDEAHPEQVRQWLEEILSETEIEPTIHEVEKLSEIYYWRRVLHQLEG